MDEKSVTISKPPMKALRALQRHFENLGTPMTVSALARQAIVDMAARILGDGGNNNDVSD